ncbi:MAG TPA: glycosyltransferase family 2 protein [Chitinophagales bacterium]|nr:glycosyltransferase family 2 protein [Chitinophagales bacterium]
MSKQLSVVIIAMNEEENIGKCIRSVYAIADEVVVVDSFSGDRTVEVAGQMGVRVVQHKFEGHIQQKNWAKEQAAKDWILSLDADETLSPELLLAIAQWKKENNATAQHYRINRLNFYCGKPVKTCGWYPDSKIRLWGKGTGEWRGTNPHDKFTPNDFREVTALMPGDILHDTYPNREAFLSQREKFATISAQHLKNESILFLLLKLLFSPPVKFIRTYFVELGFTDGATGLFICYHLSREVALKYSRAIKFKYA